MPVATKKKAIRSKTVPRRPKYRPKKELTLTQKRLEYEKYLATRRKDKAKQERTRAKASSQIETAKAKKYHVREVEKRQTGFARRVDTIATNRMRESEKRETINARKTANIESTQAREQASAERINKRYAAQTQIEEERLQRRMSYNEVQAARQRNNGTTSQSSGISRSVSQPVQEGSTSIVGGIFRILAVIVGLALLLFIVSHANQSSGAINNFGNVLFGLTSNQPLFTPKSQSKKGG